MFWLVFGLWLCALELPVCAADTYTLADGSTLSGDVVTFSDTGVIIRQSDDKYTDRMPWTKFSQEGLQQFAQNPKIRPLVEPFINPPPAENASPAKDIQIQDVSRLALPAPQSLPGAMFSSSVGLFLVLLIYAANLYGAYEVAVCRGRPVPVVMGISAVLPVVGPAIFFSLPTLMKPSQTGTVSDALGMMVEAADQSTPNAPAAAAGQAPAGGSVESAAPVDPEFAGIQVSAVSATAEAAPVAQVFKRGQFTFNRRFFETKFAGFQQVTRSEADKKLDFIVKVPQGELVVERILRIGTGDLDLEVIQEGRPKVVLVAFGDIAEINIKSKTT